MEKMSLGLPGGLWEGAITNSNKHAQENTQNGRKMETPCRHFAKSTHEVGTSAQFSPARPSCTQVVWRPSPEGCLADRLMLLYWLRHTAGIRVLSDSLEYNDLILLGYHCWLDGLSFCQIKNVNFVTNSCMEVYPEGGESETSVPFECARACCHSLIGASLTALTKRPLRRRWRASAGPSPVSTGFFTFALLSLPLLLSQQPSTSCIMKAAGHQM